MSKCFENFRMFDDQVTPCPDILNSMSRDTPQNSQFDIILSKYLNNDQLTDIELQQLSQQDRLLLQQIKVKNGNKKAKRADEYQKLFYKKAFKFAQTKFFAKAKKNKSRRMSQFYHYHFQSAAIKKKVPLINFYHPDKKTRPGFKTGQKSFNSTYIRLLLSSNSFKKIGRQYHSIFIKECVKQRNIKVTKFINSIKKAIQKNKMDRTQIIKYLQSSKCKIPWSNQDILQAWKRAYEELGESEQDDIEQDEQSIRHSNSNQNSIIDQNEEFAVMRNQQNDFQELKVTNLHQKIIEQERLLEFMDLSQI